MFLALITLLSIHTSFSFGLSQHNSDNEDWAQYNFNLKNDKYNKHVKIKENEIKNIKFQCEVNYTRTSSSSTYQATPIIVDDVMYWSGNAGYIGAAFLSTTIPSNGQCPDKWVINIREKIYGDVLFLGTSKLVARVTPAYYKDINNTGKIVSIAAAPVVFGEVSQYPADWARIGMRIFQIDAESGLVDWVRNLDNQLDIEDALHSSFSSPTIHEGVAYFGLSAALNANFASTPFMANLHPGQFPYHTRGKMIAFDLVYKTVKWKQFSLPSRPASLSPQDAWYSGGGIWTSGPSILKRSNLPDLVLFGSGQLYSAPNETIDCLNSDGSIYGTEYLGNTGGGCLDCYNQMDTSEFDIPLMSNSIIALNLDNGNIEWFHNAHGIDLWIATCGLFSENSGCLADFLPTFYPPQMKKILAPGPDADFGGAAPMLINYKNKVYAASLSKLNYLVILDTDDGSVFWTADMGPSSVVGGSQFGFAYDPHTSSLLIGVTPTALDVNAYSSLTPHLKLNSHKAANGITYCITAILKSVDFETAKINWEVVAPFHNDVNNLSIDLIGKCVDLDAGDKSTFDLFKIGLSVTHNLSHVSADPSIPVHVMTNPVNTPDQSVNAGGITVPGVVGKGIFYWGISGGTVFATRIDDGVTINPEGFSCEEGGLSGTGLSVTNNRIAFGCGLRSFGGLNINTGGSKVRVFELDKKDMNNSSRRRNRKGRNRKGRNRKGGN